MKAVYTFILAAIWSINSYAESSAHLVLRAYVPPSINTKFTQTQVSSTQDLLVFSSQINTRYARESQKFEVEGLNQKGLDATLTIVAGNSRTIQYELLVNHLKQAMSVHKPIFLKISAN
ncbi:MAG: hypothetical protein H7336_05030 [Bacteriovorax sp.]|nr:hypothetical protein [Bacteriovorax sp.]